MSNQLENTRLTLNSYIKDDELKKQLQELYVKIVEENKHNVRAFIPVGNVETETLNVGDLEAFTDYEVQSGNRYDEDGNEFRNEEQYKSKIDELANEKFDKWYVKLDEEDNEYDVFTDQHDQIASYETETEARDRVVEEKQEWIDNRPEFEDLERAYHEIYWNTVWRFNGDLNREVADKVGLGYLEHTKSEDEYLFLLGAGQDMTPDLIAYQALAFGYIEEKYLRYFDQVEVNWTKYVMGKKIFKEVCEKLGIERFFVEANANDQ